MMNSTYNDSLYHYTSHDGIAGIFGDKTIIIHATGIGYLNNPSEFQYADDLLEECINKSGILKSGKHDMLRETLKSVKSYFTKEPFFIFSLSADGDLLSQWRSYCSQGGYAIGFSRRLLSSCISKYGSTLEQCVYKREVQKPMVDATLRRLVSSCDKKYVTQKACNVETHVENSVIVWYVMDWIKLAVRLKDEAYEAEQEWRVILDMKKVEAGMSNNSTSGIGDINKPSNGFRSGKLGVIPYRQLNLTYPGELCPIESIIVSPRSDQDLAINGIYALLKERGLAEKIAVKTSRIPFRHI